MPRAIHGGVPVCFPWFGNHPTDATKPAHGFARTPPGRALLGDHVTGSVVEGEPFQLPRDRVQPSKSAAVVIL